MSMQERVNYFNYLFTYYYLNVLLQLIIITIKINVRTGTDMITQQDSLLCCHISACSDTFIIVIKVTDL